MTFLVNIRQVMKSLGADDKIKRLTCVLVGNGFPSARHPHCHCLIIATVNRWNRWTETIKKRKIKRNFEWATVTHPTHRRDDWAGCSGDPTGLGVGRCVTPTEAGEFCDVGSCAFLPRNESDIHRALC